MPAYCQGFTPEESSIEIEEDAGAFMQSNHHCWVGRFVRNFACSEFSCGESTARLNLKSFLCRRCEISLLYLDEQICSITIVFALCHA